MHYFSIHHSNGEHLGFFIMLANDETEQQPQSGRFIIKLQSEQIPSDTAAIASLEPLQSPEPPLYWAVEKDHIILFSEENQAIGCIRNEYLTIGKHTLLLNDLTGAM